MAHLALRALQNPKVQEMVMKQGTKLLEKNMGSIANKLPRNQEREEEESEDEEEKVTKKKSKKSKKKDDDDDDKEEKDEEEEEEMKKKKEEAQLSRVDSHVTKFYNIDKENALKFKKAFYEREDGMIDTYNVLIDYNNVKARIFKIKKKNNKIFSIKIMAGTESTEIPRRRLMIDGHPVDNRSIINKIIEVCIKND